ncbi:MAG: adenylyltransferase/cytidyltransferase family protein, partial [Candidatus Latescibacteria bacterium]|nr:adenylyltransferase/cytidyltransferase family protein [Candidatus Latescibacterota bacterium]
MTSTSKILCLAGLAEKVSALKEEGKRVVHCHGVFDLLHIGHIRHFEEARQHGDILIVTVTPDQFVNKGTNRPAFTGALRAESIAALDVVDFVAINKWPTGSELLRLIRPDVFCKGGEYRKPQVDADSALGPEIEVTRELGIRVEYTDDVAFSSSNLLNAHFSPFPDETDSWLADFRDRYTPEQVIAYLDEAKPKKVLVVGEAIIDEYVFADAIGKSTKDPVLACQYRETAAFPGGSLAIANHLAGFCDEVGLLSLNKHRRIAGEKEQTIRRSFRRNSKRGQRRQTKQYDEYDATSTDTEFMQFYRHYFWDFYEWNRPGVENRPSENTSMQEQATVQSYDVLLRDPYQVANSTYSERRESAWGAQKIDAVKEAFGYPDDYLVDRDIVHKIALERATALGQPLEPLSVEDLIHDLTDVARFNVDRQAQTDTLVARLLATGLPGLVAFYDAVAEEHAVGKAYLTEVAGDFDAVEVFREKIQELSATGPPGVPNSVSNDVRDYLAVRLLRHIGDEFDGFMQLPKRDRIEGRYFLRTLTLKALELSRPDLDEATREEMVAPPAKHDGPSHHVSKLAEVAGGVLRRQPEEREP